MTLENSKRQCGQSQHFVGKERETEEHYWELQEQDYYGYWETVLFWKKSWSNMIKFIKK